MTFAEHMSPFFADLPEPAGLNDIEVFELPHGRYPGWYWRAAYPDSLGDCESIGPFVDEEAAWEDARTS